MQNASWLDESFGHKTPIKNNLNLKLGATLRRQRQKTRSRKMRLDTPYRAAENDDMVATLLQHPVHRE